MGIERVLLLLDEIGVAMPSPMPDVYAIVPDADALPTAIATCDALRGLGVAVVMHAAGSDGWGSMKSQFRRADASGARHALIFGADEGARGAVSIKPLREPDAGQRTVALAELAGWAATLAP
jgi:histidyl-tRNA synthetase